MRVVIPSIALALMVSCANNPTNIIIRSLDRPTSLDFACYGQPLLPAFSNVRADVVFDEETQEVVRIDLERTESFVNRTQPPSACNRIGRGVEYDKFIENLRAEADLPEGVEIPDSVLPSQGAVEFAAFAVSETGSVPPDLFGFILESDSGTLALARMGSVLAIFDTDPLTPDRNAISVGDLPVDLVTDASGCHVTVANAGSCDLADVGVESALAVVLESRGAVDVKRLPMVNANGDRLAVAPRALARSPREDEFGAECPADATGVVYVALPGCSLVAAIDPGTGEMQGGVAFSGTVGTVVDGSFTCPVECGAGAQNLVGDDPAGLQPSVISVTAEDQLIIAGADSNIITIVNLDEDGLPVAGEVFTVALEGDVGVSDVATTGPVNVGGDNGVFGAGLSGEREYLYAIASDRSVRVIDIGALTECDTQVDPRFLRTSNSAGLLACFAVGAAETPPRRALAEGPGIRLPNRGVPTTLAAYAQTSPARRGGVGVQFNAIDGGTLVGHFMLVGSSDGRVYVVNVDDDLYPDFGTLVEEQVYTTLAVPHQLRDSFLDRGGRRINCSANDSIALNTQGPRARSFVQTFNASTVSRPNIELLPNAASVGCQIGTEAGESVPEEGGNLIDDVPELSFVSPLTVRQWAFPDLLSVITERWSVTYEGLLSRDDGFVPVDGPIARLGGFSSDGDQVVLQDNSSPFCAAGLEPFDVVNLLGCASEFDCGPSETCVFSAEAPAGVTNGLCADRERAAEIESACRDVLVTLRRYSAIDSTADRLTLVPRREVLEVSPVEGCTSDVQCEEFAAFAQRINGELPAEDTPPLTEEELEQIRGQYACEPDPSRRPGRNWCALRCDDSPDENGFPTDPCDPGQACVDNRCVQAVVPPAECFAALQAYSLAAGESFVAVSARVTSVSSGQEAPESPTRGRSATGFLHPLIVDPASDTRECIENPNASSLLRGRIRPYELEECTGPVEVYDPAAPNPCLVSDFGNQVLDTDGESPEIRTEVRRAVRFSNPIFTFHILLPELTLDTADGEVEYSALHRGVGVTFDTEAGFSAFPAFQALSANNVIRRPSDIRVLLGPNEDADPRFFIVDEGNVFSPVNARGQVVVIDPFLEPVADEPDLVQAVLFGAQFFLR